MQLKKVVVFTLIAMVLGLSASLYAQTASKSTVVRLSNLKAQASFNSASIAQVKLGYSVYVLKRQGAWVYVQGVKDKRKGWLRSFQLRNNVNTRSLQAAAKAPKGGFFTNLSRNTSALLGGRNKQSNKGVVATIGVRGLSEQELQEAEPNPEELKKMQSYVSSKDAAQAFARQVNLTTAKLQ